MKKREIPFMAQYENEFGYHEWTTLDSANNLVRCYYNGDTELHVKEPWCECNGVRMRKVRNQEKWRCPICGKVYDISDIDWPMPYWDDETGLKTIMVSICIRMQRSEQVLLKCTRRLPLLGICKVKV